ncbi:YoaK family protein [Peptostreptococcus canis]|nr:YoaK family protein [Peptostreptococcus canis]MBP1997697.1 uncharacterized membrane protein YoaK (UPF0700 family) [Peptostreptococcus canis]
MKFEFVKNNIQMSESTLVGVLLTFGGGFRDAYSYNIRGHIFANAQTGNLVLMGHNLANGNFISAFKYVLPILAFIIGVYLTDYIKSKYKYLDTIHWRQIIIFLEFVMLFGVGFMPHFMDSWANITISLVCAMQVESFRKFVDIPIATTMCTGNMRSGTEILVKYSQSKKFGKPDKSLKKKSLYYYFIILVFCIGAAFGAFISSKLGIKTIWIDSFIMFLVFILMFKKEKGAI